MFGGSSTSISAHSDPPLPGRRPPGGILAQITGQAILYPR